MDENNKYQIEHIDNSEKNKEDNEEYRK